MKAIFPNGLRVFADKAYQRGGKPVDHDQGITLFTPVKKEKGQKLLDAADRLLSSAISGVRQPIECAFSWIEEKTKIQAASKVRFYEGLWFISLENWRLHSLYFSTGSALDSHCSGPLQLHLKIKRSSVTSNSNNLTAP